jgi:hypothetical protein
MRRLFLAAASVLALALPAPAAADSPNKREDVGERINVLAGTPTEYPAGAPFHIGHGWPIGGTEADPGEPLQPKQAGIYDFRLEIDGVLHQADYVIRVAFFDDPAPLKDAAFRLFRIWVHEFPDGMTGTHTFTGHWYSPCWQAVERFGYPGPCPNPNAPTDPGPRSLTVHFIP